MNEICLIVVYFGKMNNYFDLWLKTAEYNSTIDFLIVTDQKICSTSKNIKIIDMSMNDFEALSQRKINTKIKISKPYKICDFKPAFGHILEDYLKNYAFWGHCDLDIIWGDIRKFLSVYDYSKYDKFLDRGHLTIYRNINKVNKLYETVIPEEYNYKKIFLYQHNFLFDESPLLEKICNHNDLVVFNEPLSADIDTVYTRFKHAFPGKVERTKNYDNQLFYYQEGHVYKSFETEGNIYTDEYAYIHLQKRKNLTKENDLHDSFYITNKGFFKKNKQDITIKEIMKYNNYPGRNFEDEEYLNYYKKGKKSRFKAKIENNFVGKYIVRIFNEIKYRFN